MTPNPEHAALDSALAEALEHPTDDARWDEAERAAVEAQRQESVAAAYRKAIESKKSADVIARIGQRALGWHEEWLGEDAAELPALLDAVLAIDPQATWAFQRLTMLHTAKGRWDELLAVYDRAIEHAASTEERRALLDEATNIAKDFASDVGATLRYMRELVRLAPEDKAAAQALERQLERHQKWDALIELWRDRATLVTGADRAALHVKVAETLHAKLGRADEGVDVLRGVLAAGDRSPQPLELLERIAQDETVDGDARREALSVLAERYKADGRDADVVRTLEAALLLSEGGEGAQLHRETAKRMRAQGDDRGAFAHWLSVLELEPTATDALGEVRGLAPALGEGASLVRVLDAAASATREPGEKASLLVEAGERLARDLGDAAQAIVRFRAATTVEGTELRSRKSALRRLGELLGGAGRHAEELDALRALIALETAPLDRRALTGQAARLAERIGAVQDAVALWQACVDADAGDVEATDALITILDRESEDEALAEALLTRAERAGATTVARMDLVRVARLFADRLGDVERSVGTWRKLIEVFGEDAEAVDALSQLYQVSDRHGDRVELLLRAAEREAAHAAEIFGEAGGVLAASLGDRERAAACFARALTFYPAHAGARAGLEAFLGDGALEAVASDALAEAYRRTEDWRGALRLVDARVRLAKGAEERAEILAAAAAVAETRGADAALAFDLVARAFAEAPESTRLERELMRLGEAAGQRAETVDALAAAASALGEAEPRGVDLRRRVAALTGEWLGAWDKAAEAYVSLLARAPEDTDLADRAAGAAVRAEDAESLAEVAVTHALARGAVPAGLLARGDAFAAKKRAAWVRAVTDRVERSAPTGRLAHDLWSWIAGQAEAVLSDDVLARKALRQALEAEPLSRDALVELARLLRAAPSAELCAVLERIAGLDERDLDALGEAVSAAAAATLAPAEEERLLRRLLERSVALWRQGLAATGRLTPDVTARATVDQLASRLEARGAHAEVAAVALDAAGWPVTADERAAWLARGAGAALAAGQRDRAASTYRRLLDEVPGHRGALDALARLAEEDGRLPEMLALRKTELELTEAVDRRLALRLDIVRLVGEIEARSGRVEALRANLREVPGHLASIEALIRVLEQQGRFAELAEDLTTEARHVEFHGDAAVAARLWQRVAALSEGKLGDVERAVQAYRRAVELAVTPPVLDALARIRSDQGDHASAAQWLERRLAVAEPGERSLVARRLARANLDAGQRDRAIQALELAFREDPTSASVRTELANALREEGRSDALAWLLTEAAPHMADPGELEASALEAGRIDRGLGKQDRSLPLLVRAAEFCPGAREVRVLLADAYRVAGHFDHARTVLAGLIEEFGRRRSAERAHIHFLLAEVEQAAGDPKASLEQLDLASSMDSANGPILRTLGDYALASGDVARAERAYRALLLVVRRQAASDDPDVVGLSEVHWGLHRVAVARGDDAQAAEQLAQAKEHAAQSDVETDRFVRTLLRADAAAIAVDVLAARLKESGVRARLLASLGRILSQRLGRGEEGLTRLLESIAEDPHDDAVHREARLLAVELDASRKYADALERALEARAATDPKTSSDLGLRLVRVVEEDLEDLDAALAAARRVETLGVHRPEAWTALARIAKAQGDRRVQAEALERIVTSSEGSVAPPVRTDALFGLAEIRITEDAAQDEGVDLLAKALEREPRYTLAGGLLKRAKGAPTESLMALYGRVARSSTDGGILLDFLERKTESERATLNDVREAFDLARSSEAWARAEQILTRGMALARETEGGLGAHLWVPRGLADLRFRAHDTAGALRWVKEAAEAAEGEAALGLWLEAAKLASDAGEHEAAKEILAQQFAAHPGERRVWEAYLGVLRTLGDDDTFEAVYAEVVEGLSDAGSRNAVRLERAKYLLGIAGREADAADVLRQVLADDPAHGEAAKLLADVFERTGYSEELEALLTQQLEVARAERNTDELKSLSLRLGNVLARVRRDAAMEVYRHALTWLPEDRDVASELLALFPADHDAAERAATLERLLRTEAPEGAEALALDVADRYAALGDDAAVARVLEFCVGVAPFAETSLARLREFYSAREAWAELASLEVRDARQQADRAAQVARFRAAAALYLGPLGDPATASTVLGEAHEAAPFDMALLGALVEARVAAGQLEEAAEVVSHALEAGVSGDGARAELLRARGAVRAAMGQDADAISDFEQAYALGGSGLGAPLVAALEAGAARAHAGGDADLERNRVLRLVQVVSELGDGARAREVLGGWVDLHREDAEAIELLCALDEAGERWDALVDSTARLAAVTEGERHLAAVVAHADACAKAGRPEDAKNVLEAALSEDPESMLLRDRLEQLYGDAGFHAELAILLSEKAKHETRDDVRHGLLRRAGNLFIQAGNPDAALVPLEEAVRIKPNDHESVLLLVDGLIAAQRYADAGSILEQAIEAHPKKRSPELAALQLRMSVLAERAGDPGLQLQWLQAAVESDRANGDIVARLAHLAMAQKEYEVANNALRIVTLSRNDGPMSRAMAFLLQARIAHEQGDQRRAILFARKAKSEDANLGEADTFLATLGA